LEGNKLKKYVVAYVSFFNNELLLAEVEANSEREAVVNHPHFLQPGVAEDNKEWFKELPEDMGDIETFFYDCDSLIKVIEIGG